MSNDWVSELHQSVKEEIREERENKNRKALFYGSANIDNDSEPSGLRGKQSIASTSYDDILHSIFQLLRFRELATTAGVSRHWNKAVSKCKLRKETIGDSMEDLEDYERLFDKDRSKFSMMTFNKLILLSDSSMQQHVTTLDMSDSTIQYCIDDPTGFINSFSNITWLDLSSNNLQDFQLDWLDILEKDSLTHLNLTNNCIGIVHVTHIADAIAEPTCGLVYLNLSDNGINEQCVARLAKGLEKNKSISTLELHNNYIKAKGIRAIAKSLKCNTTITHLNMRNTTDTDGGIAEILNASTTLQYLDISTNGVLDQEDDEEECLSIINAIKQSPSLTSLYMSENFLTNDLAIPFADAIVGNQTLTCLDISSNEISDSGVSLIADAVLNSKSMVELNISYCDCGPMGLVSICNLIKYGKLKTLHMRHLLYYMDDADCVKVAEAIKCSKSLTSIHLGHNHIRVNGTMALAEAISICPTLTHVGLESNSMGRFGRLFLEQYDYSPKYGIVVTDHKRSNLDQDGFDAEQGEPVMTINLWQERCNNDPTQPYLRSGGEEEDNCVEVNMV